MKPLKLRTTVVILVLLIYVLSYFGWSRYSRHTMRDTYGTSGFYYIHPAASSPYRHKLNVALSYFYYPVWAADHYLYGGPAPASEPVWRVGK